MATISTPDPNFKQTIMGDMKGGANDATMTEILTGPSGSVTCAKGVSAGVGPSC